MSPDSASHTALKPILADYTRRYRKQLLAHAGILAVLLGASAGVLFWRLGEALSIQDARRWIPIGTAAAGLAVLAAWAVWRWRSAGGAVAAAEWDKRLGLQQRLTTVVEYGEIAASSSLYPLLVQDTTARVGRLKPEMPRALPVLSAALAVLLLMLLLWPHATPPVPPLADQQNPPQGEQQAMSSSGGAGAQPNSQNGQGENGQQGGQTGQQGGQPGSGQSPTGGQSANGGQQQAASGSQQGGSQPQSDGQPGNQQSPNGQGQQGNQQSPNGQGQQSSASAAQQGEASSDGNKPGMNPAAGQKQGAGPQPGTPGSEATKEEIRELLEEMSGEVKNLQEQLRQAQPIPVIGNQSDPNLYGTPETIEKPGEGNTPVQLKTDGQETQSKRQGSGVGKASGEISSEAPKAAATDAQLSDDPAEEAPVSRQSVPPEYRSVFDNLHQR